MKERRKFVRIPGDKIKVKVRIFEGDISNTFHEIDNLSIGGLIIIYKDELKLGDYVLLTIDPFQAGINHLIKCVANIVRVEKKEEGYDTAFKFEKIARDDIRYLNSIVEKLDAESME